MPTELKPPVAKIQPHIFTLHGDTRIDPYYWLRERSNPEVMAYLEAENQYTAAMLKHTEAFQEKLYQELLGRIKETDQSALEKQGDYYYYTRTETGLAYPIHCRRRSPEAAEEILLDQNALAEGHPFCQLGVFEVSPDHHLLAYSVDLSGAETFTLYVKDLNTGHLLPEQIPNTYYTLAWANDNQTFFYTVLDEAKRPFQLYRHTLGTDPQEDALIYHETDEMFNLFIFKSRSKSYLLLHLRQSVTSEWHYLSADNPIGQFQVIQPRQHGLEYGVDHRGEEFFILTNDQAENFRVMTVSTAAPAKENWQEIIPHRPLVKVDELLVFEDHLALFERENGLLQIRVTHLPSRETHYVDFPEPAYLIWPQGNREFETSLLRFGYSSLITPNSVFDYDMNSRTRDLKKQDEVPGGYDSSHYESERIFATAPDGVKVPISLVYKKGLAKDGSHPLFLHGYGAYEASMDAYFASRRLSLLERGFIFAIPHIRGGGEMGRPWYKQGKLLHKRNTFTDFIACAEHLIAEKYTSSAKLVILGRSAGGLLMGAVNNMRPDLFKAVVAQVPFVDAISTMLDPSIPLTTTEYEEWGNPADQVYYNYIKSYSPYDNIEAKAYPHLLITAGLNDPRVQYWEPAKWVAKLRALKTDQNTLLFKIDMSAGHSGPSNRYEYLKETAFTYAFVLDQLGFNE